MLIPLLNQQRGARVSANNSNLDDKKDRLCANMISEVVKLEAEKVKGKHSRTASITTDKKVDEVEQLQKYLSFYNVTIR